VPGELDVGEDRIHMSVGCENDSFLSARGIKHKPALKLERTNYPVAHDTVVFHDQNNTWLRVGPHNGCLLEVLFRELGDPAWFFIVIA
jgi:hypothetical protein